MGNNLPKGWTSHPLKDVVSSRKGKKPATVINHEKKGYDPYLLADAYLIDTACLIWRRR